MPLISASLTPAPSVTSTRIARDATFPRADLPRSPQEEKERLRHSGKISKEEIMNAEVNDMPPRYRLACQCFVRNEDTLVTFEGERYCCRSTR